MEAQAVTPRHTRRTYAAAVICVAAFIVLFWMINFIHFRYFPVHVVLYDGIWDALIALVLMAIAMRGGCLRWLKLTPVESVLTLTIGLLVAVLYALTFPTVIDRSLSVYILEKLEQRGGAIREDALEDILVKEYFPEHRLVDIRLTEQLNSGTITMTDGCVRLTSRGRWIAAFTRYFRTTLLPRRRDIMGRLSNDLTDPFRHSKAHVPSQCK